MGGGYSIYAIFLAAIIFAYPRQKWWVGAALIVLALGVACIETPVGITTPAAAM
jgi:hypothetical protein